MEYFDPLRLALEANADPVRAVSAKAYMKGISDYYGILSPARREILGDFLRTCGYPSKSGIENIMKFAWEMPQREWQYIAMEIVQKYARKGEKEFLELAEFMILHKSWWDTVDFIAPNIAGPVFRKNPGLIRDRIEDWMSSGNMWLQRSCLLFQMRYKSETDEALLFELCSRLAGNKEFFIRKAIGWSLREYSKTSPEAVLEYANTHILSPLSYREAVKRIRIS